MSSLNESRNLTVLAGDDVEALVSPAACIELVEQAMRTVSRGGAQMPLRTVMKLAGGSRMFGVMPGELDEPSALGVKVVAVYPDNPSRGLSSHTGVVLLFDPATGLPAAVVDAAAVTALRTAAATAVATRVLARADADTLAILGTGEQAVAHLRAMLALRPMQVRLWGRTAQKAATVAEQEGASLGVDIAVSGSVEAAVRGAGIVCATTSATEPILEGRRVEPGTHVNLVGSSTPAFREADDELVAMSRFIADYLPSALAQAGEFLHAKQAGRVDDDHIVGEIGQVLNGAIPGRTSDDEVTVYKSLGVAAQDLVVAHAALERAVAKDAGTAARF